MQVIKTAIQTKKIIPIAHLIFIIYLDYYFIFLLYQKSPDWRFLLAPREGLEPPTNWLTANCSTIELSRNNYFYIYKKQTRLSRPGIKQKLK